MRSLHRATLSLALTIAPMVGTGCVNLSARNTVSATARRAEQRVTAARYEENQGNLAQAKRLYGEIHQESPQNALISHRLGVVCTRLNQLHDAEVYFLQAYGVNPKDPELLSDMGYVAFLQKNYDRSERLLELSVEQNRSDRRTINNLAIVRGWRVEDEACLSTLRSIYNEEESIRRLAAIQMARGDKDRALKNYDLAQRISGRPPLTMIAQSTTNQIETRATSTSASEFKLPAPAPIRSTPKQSNEQSTASAQSRRTRQNSIIQTSNTVELPPSPDVPAESMIEKPKSRFSKALIITMARSVELAPPVATRIAPSSRIEPKLAPPDTPNIAMAPPSIDEIPPSPVEAVVTTIAVSMVEEPPTAAVERTFDLELVPPPVEVQAPEQTKPVAIAQQTIPEPPEALPLPESETIRINTWYRTPVSRGGQHVKSPAPATIKHSITEGTSEAPEAGLRGVCLVTLYEEKRIVPVGLDFTAEYQSQHYQFHSAAALEKFKAAPQRYAPAAGGLDVVAVRNERRVIPGSLAFSLWYRHQLYLFSSRENADAFRRDPDTFVAAH